MTERPPELLPRKTVESRRRPIAGFLVLLLLWVGGAAWGLSALTNPVGADATRQYDAVVVLATGSGERLGAGLELVDDDVAPLLVISTGANGTWYAAGEICRLERSIAVECPDPDPVDTRGEVGMIRRFMVTEEWDSVLIVTSSYHRLRVSRMVGQCGLENVDVVGMTPHISRINWLGRLVHEVGGNLATTVVRGCL